MSAMTNVKFGQYIPSSVVSSIRIVERTHLHKNFRRW